MSSRLVTFADGFSSASAPVIAGGIQEEFSIGNGITGGALFTLNSSENRTVFMNYEILRETNLSKYLQSGELVLIFTTESGWIIAEGLFAKDPNQAQILTQDAVENSADLRLILNPLTGVMTYDSGTIAGTDYIGHFKSNTVRIA